MISVYERAIKFCGQQAVHQQLTNMIYEEQSRRMKAFAPDSNDRKIKSLEDLSDWLKVYGFNPESIKSKCRLRKIVIIRKALCYYLSELKNFTLNDTAIMLGYKDHTTVMYHKEDFSGLLEIEDKNALKILATLIQQNETETV